MTVYIYAIIFSSIKPWTSDILSDFQINFLLEIKLCNVVIVLIAGWFGSWLIMVQMVKILPEPAH